MEMNQGKIETVSVKEDDAEPKNKLKKKLD